MCYGLACSAFFLHNTIFHFNSGFSASFVRAAANWAGFTHSTRAQDKPGTAQKGGFYCPVLSMGIAQALGSRRRGHDRGERGIQE